MGAISESFAAFAQPLLDQTDGSQEEVDKALKISQIFWNLSLLPEADRDKAINDMQPMLNANDKEFELFRLYIVIPMMERHKMMFPHLHRSRTMEIPPFPLRPTPTKKYAGTGRNSPCPCGSGKKYKFCCGR